MTVLGTTLFLMYSALILGGLFVWICRTPKETNK